ncbi:RNA polymerase sigma factor SigJ [Nocardia sp. AG03]|uniref:RNA polymerase sigma factor SigJ n=1 Tax=Nocardia sp. AG03 TaxID=3025312 RepID=UPI0024181845|nr:RNA polymerase sigma factor SigJ [Nocardia sp. AG03]
MTDSPTTRYLGHRELLFSIVYNMLGSVADTEDVLQDVWLAWTSNSERHVDNPRAYLVRIAINAALARRATVQRRRETYVGQWLPEPLLTEPDAAEPVLRTETFSMALLVVLETLSPLERATFVLHEAFAFSHTEIAEMLGRSPAAVRQLAHRAREHVRARRPRHPTDDHTRAEVTRRFVEAALGGDLTALLDVLAPEVTLWTDGGGKGPAVSLRPVRGRDRVAALFNAVAAGIDQPYDVRYRPVNGDASALIFDTGAPLAAIIVEVTDGRVQGIYAVTNPDKLTHVG